MRECESSNRLEFLKKLFDTIANEAPVDNDDQDPNLDNDELTDSREIFWQRDSIVAKLEPPSTAIVEALRRRQFEDWVSGDADNWLEQIAQIVSSVEIEIPVNGDRLLQFLIGCGEDRRIICQRRFKNVTPHFAK